MNPANPRFPLDALNALTLRANTLSSLDEGPALAAEVRALGSQLVENGLPGTVLGRLLGTLNDVLTERLIALASKAFRLPQVPWAWLALGSQGRFEQTLVTDQDNALVFSATDAREADALREGFLPFCQHLNARFDDCGFVLCSGGIMAGNPECCLSLGEWRQRFSAWVRRPEAQALLQASIFFDFRPLFGATSLAEQLRSDLFAMTQDTPLFLHLMAGNALRAELPIGRLGDFHLVETKGRRGVDLKHCARIVVDSARIFALAQGSAAVDTVSRLSEAGPAIGLSHAETSALVDAFGVILRVRYAHQTAQAKAGEVSDNLLDPASLHELDRAMLKAAILQTRIAQQRLRLTYGL